MFRKDKAMKQRGASMVEAMIAVPIILVACLLTLQVMLLYRAKIALNFATQEAARVGSMSNARIVPRFLTDVTQFMTVFRKKTKCVKPGGGAVAAVGGSCPSGSSPEPAPPGMPSSSVSGSSSASDGLQPSGSSFSGASGDQAAAPPAPPTRADAAAAQSSGNNSAVAGFMKSLGRGMLRYGDSSVLQGFVNGITPLYTNGTGFLDIGKGQLAAYGDAMMNSCIIYHNPTQAAFLDFGFMEVDGPDKYVLQIPNDLMRYRIPADVDSSGKHIGYFKKKGKYLSDEEGGIRGELSTMPVQDATLLSIEIKYSYPMKVPIAREIIIGLSKLYNGLNNDETAMGRAFVNSSLDHGRWPMSSFATYRMQSPVAWNMFFPFGSSSGIRSSELEVFDSIQALWNVVAEKVNDSFDPAEPQVGFCPGLLIDSLGGNIGKKYPSDHWVGKTYDTR